MLANILIADTLAVLLSLGSVIFYLAAFFYPEVHRRFDFVWSGLALLYAIVLWLCAMQMTAALLLGQMVVVVLLLGLGWQTLSVRREKTPVPQQTPVVLTPEVVGDWAKNQLNQLRIAPPEPVPLRLEPRSLGNQRIDPRRRPAYEYEFVEDGVLADAESWLEAAIDPTRPDPITPVPPTEDLPIDLATETPAQDALAESVPPSVEAKIISVDSPEAVIAVESAAEEAIASPEPMTETPITEALEPELTQPAMADLHSVEATETEPEETEPEEAVSFQPVTQASDEPDDDWDDDFFGQDSETAEAVPSTQAVAMAKGVKSREKPNLLATPLILAGWVKDIAIAVTKPKPPKPMIDIPRREPPVAVAPSVQHPAPDPIPPENRPESNWEDSNWDD